MSAPVGGAAGHRLMRAELVLGYDVGDATVILRRGTATRHAGVALRFTGDSAALVRAILVELAEPRTRKDLLDRLAERCGEAVAWAGPVEDAVTHLREAGVIVDSQDGVPGVVATAGASVVRGVGRRVVIAIAGGVAASFAPLLCELLLGRGHEVRVATTRSALRFVAALALEALTHERVVSTLWPSRATEPVPHLALARWAEIVVVWPATASSIARIAAGSCVSPVSAIAIATRAPVLVLPSMNEAMISAPSVQRNLATLRDDGFLVALGALGVEVADAPRARRRMPGAAPPVTAVAELVDAVLAIEGVSSGGTSEPPRAPLVRDDWDALYAAPLENLPWHSEEPDPEILAALAALKHAGTRLLDVGAGAGTLAIAASDAGFAVVATDLSPGALARAGSRAGDRPIVWLEDDIRRCRLRSSFDLVVDRGLLHVLAVPDHAAYLGSIARLVRGGGHLVLKVHAEGDAAPFGTVGFTSERVADLFAPAFEVASVTLSSFSGSGGSGPRALLCVLRRRADVAGQDARR